MRGTVTRLLIVLAIAACATPAGRFSEHAARVGLRPSTVRGAGFDHVVFAFPAGRPSTPPGEPLHIYLDGDGTPPAMDPTPRRPLVLDLMARDPGPAVYLGRPCYHGFAGAAACESALWNERRYADEIVESLVAAASRVLDEGQHERAVLIGYSGGGTLAMLMARRLARVTAVLTVAANLDTDLWTTRLGMPRLNGSRNPARERPLSTRLVQRHYVGTADRVVPPDVVSAGPIPADSVRRIDGYDHVCCWVERWPAILDDLRRLLATPAG